MGQETIEDKLLKATKPVIASAPRGPIVGTCPEHQGTDEFYCWKFKDLNPQSAYDFFLFITIARVGKTVMMSMLVPLGNKGYLRAVKMDKHETIMENTYVKTIKSSVSNYGVAHIARLRIEEYYRELKQTIFSVESFVDQYDDENKFVKRFATPFNFPPLPDSEPSEIRTNDSEYWLNQLSCRNLAVNDRMVFSISRPLDDGDYEIDNGWGSDDVGFSSKGNDSIAVESNRDERQPNSIYVEFAHQPGNIGQYIEIYWRTDEQGIPHFMWGLHCSSYNYEELREYVFVKKKRSWFKKKTKITIIRKEFRKEGVKYDFF
jgi:hypothetical protein